ncbi:hypothetical protein DB345_09520 [Spartobacteria bacterium LR76]|nr:hypothetical protein DB345_09520 [Spartobacteria bacterium LR76]
MKHLSILTAALALALHPVAAQILTNFGSDQFTITYSDFTDTQTQSSLHISGTDFGSELSGIVSTVVIPASAIQLTLTGTLSGANPGSAFQIALLDTVDNAVYFDGSWSSYSPGVETSVVLNRYEPVPAFNGNVVRIALFTAGTGSSLNFTLKELKTTTVPEPSLTAALLVGLGGLFVHYRYGRRRLLPERTI